MDAPRAKATLSDLKTSPLTQQYVLVGYPDIIEQDFGMAMGGIVITKHRQRAIRLAARYSATGWKLEALRIAPCRPYVA